MNTNDAIKSDRMVQGAFDFPHCRSICGKATIPSGQSKNDDSLSSCEEPIISGDNYAISP